MTVCLYSVCGRLLFDKARIKFNSNVLELNSTALELNNNLLAIELFSKWLFVICKKIVQI